MSINEKRMSKFINQQPTTNNQQPPTTTTNNQQPNGRVIKQIKRR